jgi:hypothetical protein
MSAQQTQESPFSSLGFVVSAIGVAMLIAAAIAVVIASHTGQHGTRVASVHSTARQTVPLTRGTPNPVPTANNPRGCGLPAGEQTVPVSAPESSWTLVGAMAAPTAQGTFGPQKLENGLRVCFAHNPTGALYALASFFAESTKFSEAELFTRLAAATPAKAVAVSQAQGDSQLLQSEDGDPGTVSIAGFQYVDYTPSQANVTLVLQGPSGELAALPCSLEWQHDDWRFVIPPSQQLGASEVSSMNGFIAWSAVNS